MAITEKSAAYHEKMFPGYVSAFLTYDPEYIEFFDNWAFDELVNEHPDFPDDKRYMCILASLIGSGSVDEFRPMAGAATRFGLTGIQIKEIIYQAVPYLGVGPVFPFLKMSNDLLPELGFQPPFEKQGTVAWDKALEEGKKMQKKVCGDDVIEAFWDSFDEDTQHISRWLSAHCFGDYFTRGGLTVQEREMCVFCYLMAHGGFEEQLRAHAKVNFNVGNDRAFMIKAITAPLAFNGFPATLNGLKAINEASKA